ncbi:hypothetical protein DOS84_03120 [Flavobacterium aquariorum]|uniref:Anti-bacteriophage protein A/HamA C-terminal domain-containing protein n=1 Tax=Flavobacterium aquariorum TaxID=2217670 RepID=A0A2W7TVL1_9FLAO|nr:hypothetical protein [Flavobacterium aquariorum]PZX94563.1 hypothetical protein DOS84_03120 [Flavobacterium aquariorum]
MIVNNIFNTKNHDLGNGNTLNIIEIDEIDGNLKNYLDEKLISICYGPREIDISTVKLKILKFLNSKKKTLNGVSDNTIVMGAITEFMVHLFLNSLNFVQEFTFKNLEEGSMKKGFDGYYSLEENCWIVESKSGSIQTKGNSHATKINEAYSGLIKMLEGKTNNSPWENAYNHSIMVNSKKSISDKLNELDINYTRGKFENIKDFNIIPASTMIYNNEWDNRCNNFEDEVIKAIDDFNYKNIRVICINKKSLSNFRKYLES